MHNRFKWLLVLACLVGISFLLPHAQADTDEDSTLADNLRKKYIVQEEAVDQPQIDEETVLKNQAAGRDADLVWSFLQKNPVSELHRHFSGMYIDETQTLVVMLFGEMEASRQQLASLGLETEICIKNGEFSYYERKEDLSRIGIIVGEIFSRVQKDCGTDAEKALIAHNPCSCYVDKNNSILVRLAATDQTDFSMAIELFEKLVGKYEAVSYEACSEEALVTHACLTPVQPGRGIVIGGYGYSLGFRAYYVNGTNNIYGMVTAAHGNSLGQSVSLATTGTSIGYITLRQWSGSVDASFIQLNSGFNGSQSVCYEDQYGTIHTTATVDGYVVTPTYGTLIYKNGAAPSLLQGIYRRPVSISL